MIQAALKPVSPTTFFRKRQRLRGKCACCARPTLNSGRCLLHLTRHLLRANRVVVGESGKTLAPEARELRDRLVRALTRRYMKFTREGLRVSSRPGAAARATEWLPSGTVYQIDGLAKSIRTIERLGSKAAVLEVA